MTIAPEYVSSGSRSGKNTKRRLRESRKTPFPPSLKKGEADIRNTPDDDWDMILEDQRLADLRELTEYPPNFSLKRRQEALSDQDYRLRKERTDELVEGLRRVRVRGEKFADPHWGLKTPPPDSDDDSELSPEELRDAIIESTDMLMIDYSEEDALDILFSDPYFEVLRETRHTSLVLFSGGVHGVFFTFEVDTARAHHAIPTTDDGSRHLSSAEITALASEVVTLVTSLQSSESGEQSRCHDKMEKERGGESERKALASDKGENRDGESKAVPDDLEPPPPTLGNNEDDSDDSYGDMTDHLTRGVVGRVSAFPGGEEKSTTKRAGKTTRVALTIRQLRRVMAAKESLFKFGTFVPRSEREAESSPEAPRWRAGRDLEWLRLRDKGTFARDWSWKRIQHEFSQYKKADIYWLSILCLR
jgi:hypothetical protein